MPAPLAYFLTWTTYGTRLHGDPRGTVDLDHNQVGRPMLQADDKRWQRMCNKLAQSPFTLSPEAEDAVKEAIRAHVAFREWCLLALETPVNHVHVVVDCRQPGEAMPKHPDIVVKEFKSYGTRELRSRGIVGTARRVWGDHGSTRWINNEDGLFAAIDYVSRLQ